MPSGLRRLLSPAECEHLASLPVGLTPSYVGGAYGRLDTKARLADTGILFQTRFKDTVHRNASDLILK